MVADAAGDTTESNVSVVHKYDNFFPTLQLRYQPGTLFVARATYSTGIARPGFLQTIQATQVDEGAGTVVTGNPQLLPTFSHNFDVSAEYYLANAGIISLGAFDKEMKNYIITLAYNGLYPGYQGAYNVQSFANTPNSHVRGIEGVYVNRFTSLPGWLSGFGIDANFTYESSGAHLRPGENNALPGMFPWTWNAAASYEKYGLKLRVAGQYESSTLFTVGSSTTTDVYQNERFTLDASSSYNLNRHAEIYLNLKNLTNAPLRFYEGQANRPIQREFYDMTIEAGLKLKF
jgi:TonB-dependent receptor